MEFIKNHTERFLCAFVCLVAAVVSMGIYILIDISFESDEILRQKELYSIKMSDSAEKLDLSLRRGEVLPSYHYAREAEEYAKIIGLTAAAELFGEVSESVIDGGGSEYIEPLEKLIQANYRVELSDDFVVHETSHMRVSKYSIDRAEKAANELLGLKNTLKYVGGAERLVFSCRNAYCVMDCQTSMPYECCISLERDGEAGSFEDFGNTIQYYLERVMTTDEIKKAEMTESRAVECLIETRFKSGDKHVTLVFDKGKLTSLILEMV